VKKERETRRQGDKEIIDRCPPVPCLLVSPSFLSVCQRTHSFGIMPGLENRVSKAAENGFAGKVKQIE